MSGREEAPSGPLDVQTLELLGRRGSSHPLVSERSFRPGTVSPRRLEFRLDGDQYPPAVTGARIDVRWFVGEDYTIHYVEAHANGRWQCRWDRHPKPDGPRAHFHPPPDASGVEPSPLSADHHRGVVFAVLDRIEERNRELHG